MVNTAPLVVRYNLSSITVVYIGVNALKFIGLKFKFKFHLVRNEQSR